MSINVQFTTVSFSDPMHNYLIQYIVREEQTFALYIHARILRTNGIIPKCCKIFEYCVLWSNIATEYNLG